MTTPAEHPKRKLETCPVTGSRCSCTGHCNIEALQRKKETPDPRWKRQQFLSSSSMRWSEAELEELKGELNRRTRLDPLWQVCADAIGSLQFDLIDEQRKK